MSSHYHTPISVGAPANANTLNSPLGELDATLFDLVSGNLAWIQLNHGDPVPLTISGGEIDITQNYHTIDTEGAAASDDLVTINGGQQGDVLYLRIVSNARTVTIQTGDGNIFLSTGNNLTLSSINTVLALICIGNEVWVDGLANATSSPFSRLVSRTVLSASAATIDLSSIPTGYSILALYLELRSDVSALVDNVLIRMNGDTTAGNYYSLGVSAESTGVTVSENLGAVAGVRILNGAVGNTAPSGYRSNLEILLPNYLDTAAARHVTGEGYAQGGNSAGNLHSLTFGGTWTNTANAINQLTILPVSGSNFLAGSAYELYGIL